MHTLNEFLGHRIRFKTINNNAVFVGKFVGVGKAGNVVGLIFDGVTEAVCKNINSTMLIHPNQISPRDGMSFEFIQHARIVFKNNNYKQNDALLFYPANKIKKISNTKMNTIEVA